MDRKKPPALTSPWKVGFLVALLLVVTGLGVSYFISGTFGVRWTWLTVNGPSPAQWSVQPALFMEQMIPLLGLIAMLAFASHVLVSGAVRRYKSYVDSGVEYKQLLRSIKSIEDLDDEEKAEQLKQHPELREFLLGFKRRLATNDKPSNERERRGAPATEHSTRLQALATEAAAIAAALANGSSGLARDLNLSIPELKQIERAARQFLAQAPAAPPAGSGPREEALQAILASLRSAVATVRRDADACASGGRELEATLATLRQPAQSPAPALSGGDIAGLVNRVEQLADALSVLGEDTKRIAIASALQASGGTESDSIKVADELRTVATKFNTIAGHWKQTTPVLRQALEVASASAESADKQRATLVQSLASLTSKVNLWNERLVALAEQVRGLDRMAEVSGASAAPVSAPAEPRVEFEGTALRQPRKQPPVAVPSLVDDDFVTARAGGVFDATATRDGATEGVGFEKEKRFFADASAAARPAEPETDPRFVVDGNDTDTAAWEDPNNRDLGDDDMPALPPENDGFLTGPRSTVSAASRDTSRPVFRANAGTAAPAPAPAPASTVATLEKDADADAIDLYALGAVDFDARVHASA